MKYLFASALLVCCLCISQLIAQPVLNLSGIPPFGTVLTSSEVDGTGINPGAAGANQTWNFTAFPDTGIISTFEITNPSETLFFSQFPTATSVSVGESSYQGVTNYVNTYTRETENEMELLGTVIYDESFESVFSTILINPQTIFAFPSTLNSTYADTYEAPGNFLDPESTVIGNTSYTVDAYGTLITNSGSYPNTLRFKRREIVLDTFYLGVDKIPIPIYSESKTTRYDWVHVQNGGSFTVWSIAYDTVTTSGGFGPPQETFSSSVNHSFSNINVGKENFNLSSEIGLYPNPADKQVLFCLPQDATVSLLDLSGRLIKNKHFSIADGAMPIMELNDVPVGTYLVKAEGHNYIATSKILVMH